jgi:hypothetical protein
MNKTKQTTNTTTSHNSSSLIATILDNITQGNCDPDHRTLVEDSFLQHQQDHMLEQSQLQANSFGSVSLRKADVVVVGSTRL